ncbi:MAG: protein-export chaperone SecB [Chromatiales bacterium]|nr:protein-export chaperone SecB [Chromatiales bacterium]
MTEQNNAAAGGNGQDQRNIALQKIYVKDLSFESPNAPKIFTMGNLKPDVGLNLNSSAKSIGPDTYEVNISCTVTVKHEDQTLYLVEVQQAGVFMVKGFSKEETQAIVGAYCPNMLFPYAREAISDIVGKGGFPQLLLAPVDFGVLYQQHLQQQQGKREDAEQPQA